MKKFLVIFTCAEKSPNHEAWMKLSSSDQQDLMARGNEAQKKWDMLNKNFVIDEGHSLGNVKQVDESGVKTIPKKQGKYMVVEAESHEAASRIFLNHPHFSFFPGDGVEVIEILS